MPSAATGSSPSPGYSGTPLVRKLGVKPGHKVTFVRRPASWEIPELPPDVEVVDAKAVTGSYAAAVGAADVVVVFSTARAELAADIAEIAGELAPTSALWCAWPRRAGGHTSDITENLLRELLLPTGLVDVKVAALDTDWSGLRFVWRKDRRSPTR